MGKAKLHPFTAPGGGKAEIVATKVDITKDCDTPGCDLPLNHGGDHEIRFSDKLNPSQQVLVDAGDLLEACEAANRWAGRMRGYADLDPSLKHLQIAADRIDMAVKRLRNAS